MKLSHLDSKGRAHMVNVGHKPPQRRVAVAEGLFCCAVGTIRLLQQRALPKGDVLTVAQVAGIQAAKRAGELIPLCHPLNLDHIEVTFAVEPAAIRVRCTVASTGRTGVEMEALTGVSIACLALYDMCKAVDRNLTITDVRVRKKTKR